MNTPSTDVSKMREVDCMRLRGQSAYICQCRTPDGFRPCPPEAIGVMTPTYPPIAYVRVAEQMRQERGQREAVVHRIGIISAENGKSAYAGGYTGSICDVCGSPRMRRSGTCETCDDCGAAGGCG